MEEIKKNRRLVIMLLFIILLIIVDQLTKYLLIGIEKNIIEDTIKIYAMKNYGGAFGVGQKGTMTFIITNIIVIGIIVKFLCMQKEQIDKKTYFSLSLVIAGAISNLIDKIFRGYVLEIICIKSLGINLADIIIVLGWVLLALFFATYTYKIKNKKE